MESGVKCLSGETVTIPPSGERLIVAPIKLPPKIGSYSLSVVFDNRNLYVTSYGHNNRLIQRVYTSDGKTKTLCVKEDVGNRKFHDSKMPVRNSKWILCIPNAVPIDGAMNTFHGAIGRIESTQENLDAFLQELERSNAELKQDKQKTLQKFKEIIANSEGVYVGQYAGFEERTEGVTWYQPPKAFYYPKEFITGPPFGTRLPIKFEFGDKNQGPPPNWKFHESMMPTKKSKWILAIPNCVPIDGMLETYHGAAGRIEATENNLELMYEALKLVKEEHK